MAALDDSNVLVMDDVQAPLGGRNISLEQSISSHPNILPDSRLKRPTNIYHHLGLNWVPTFCANCGAPGPFTPEENMTFFFYLCQPCAETWGPIAGTYMEPDAVFFQRVKQEQLEKYGRELTAPEMIEILKDGNNSVTKLVNERRR
jgi:hypothetical protein